MPLKQIVSRNKRKGSNFFIFLFLWSLGYYYVVVRGYTQSSTRLITWHVMRVTYAGAETSHRETRYETSSQRAVMHAQSIRYIVCDARVSHWAIISIGELIVKLPSHSIETKMYIRVCWERERARRRRRRAGYYIAEWATSSPVELLCWAVRLYRSCRPERRQWNASIQADDMYSKYICVCLPLCNFFPFNKIIIIIKKTPSDIKTTEHQEKKREINETNHLIYVMVYTDDIIQGRAGAKSETSRSFSYIYL